jgi:hypothetical protein
MQKDIEKHYNQKFSILRKKIEEAECLVNNLSEADLHVEAHNTLMQLEDLKNSLEVLKNLGKRQSKKLDSVSIPRNVLNSLKS